MAGSLVIQQGFSRIVAHCSRRPLRTLQAAWLCAFATLRALLLPGHAVTLPCFLQRHGRGDDAAGDDAE
jgi:hypothetical protein